MLGGWAVYAYNSYSKSQDIDLLLSASDRGSLQHWLKTERGYEKRRRTTDGWHGAVLHVEPLDKDIIVDIATYGLSYPFEGKQGTLNFDLTLDHKTHKEIAGVNLAVPNRSLLLLYKAKAAWDRGYRVDEHESPDEAWEQKKRVKDRSDILALTDDEHVKDPWELRFLNEALDEHPFLVDILQEAPKDPSARARYREIPEDDARNQLQTLMKLLGR